MQAKQRAASNHCPEAAEIVTLMLAKDGYHVTRPTGAGENTVALIGSTDMTEGTVEEVKAALRAEHETLMHLRAAGCTKIGFYGDHFGPLGKDIDLEELP
jgi:galactokinase